MLKQSLFLASLLIASPVLSAERDEALSHVHDFEKSAIDIAVPYTDVDISSFPFGYVGDLIRDAKVTEIHQVGSSEIVDFTDGAIAVTSTFEVGIETFKGEFIDRACMKTWMLVKRAPENSWGTVFQSNGFVTYCDGHDMQKFSEGATDERYIELEAEAIERLGARYLHPIVQSDTDISTLQ